LNNHPNNIHLLAARFFPQMLPHLRAELMVTLLAIYSHQLST